MTKTDLNLVYALVLCLYLMSFYSAQVLAQETETEATVEQTSESDNQVSDTQDETTTDSDADSTTAENTVVEEEAKFDVDELVVRMKQTDAIGVITKLSLKNQVDDLLEKAEKIKQDNDDATDKKSKLREDFEGLILKTVTLLNKGEDYNLAEDIYLAKEQLWESIMENKA